MAPEHLERAFEMFARLERPGSTGERGLGVGLALGRRLAVLHGGTLAAESGGPGRGTTFTLSLPAVEAQVESPEPEPFRDDSMTPLRIVVIEDSDDIADTLAALLEEMGHSVAVARTGPLGLALVGSQRPDLVLCDLGLPGMDGIEVCRRVRRLDLGTRPVMVALTGWGREDDRRRTREAGFDEHLVKPVAAERLARVLRDVSARSAQAPAQR